MVVAGGLGGSLGRGLGAEAPRRRQPHDDGVRVPPQPNGKQAQGRSAGPGLRRAAEVRETEALDSTGDVSPPSPQTFGAMRREDEMWKSHRLHTIQNQSEFFAY